MTEAVEVHSLEAPPYRFRLRRDHDVSGVSGIGYVADGVLFNSGLVVIHWGGENPTVTTHVNGMKSIREIHGHNGLTVVEWIDDPNDVTWMGNDDGPSA